jgi:glutaredoxin 3
MYIELYSKPNCQYCSASKILLKQNNIPFHEKTLDIDFTREYITEKYPSAKSYPIVIIDGYYIGGYSQLHEEISKKENRTFLTE